MPCSPSSFPSEAFFFDTPVLRHIDQTQPFLCMSIFFPAFVRLFVGMVAWLGASGLHSKRGYGDREYIILLVSCHVMQCVLGREVMRCDVICGDV